MRNAIPYYRVSTIRQGQSGLGLAAQRKNIRDFVAANKYKLLKGYIEVESTKKSNRPVLQKALRDCKKHNAVLLIAKLDRLGRNVAFISALMESDVDFIAVDNPTANKFMVHIMAAFAEYERDQISLRTKEALKAAKRRGVILGRFAKTVLSKKNIKASKAFAKKMQPIIKKLKREGFHSVRKIKDQLNKRKIPTFSGKKGKWHVTTVQNLLKKIELLNP
jgi:DNA invertase Pin-like site-specific DNA recombinase